MVTGRQMMGGKPVKTELSIVEELTALPDEARREAMDFIIFLRQQHCGSRSRRPVGKASLGGEPFVGMWANRDDMKDSSMWVRQTRSRDWGH